MNSQDKIFHRRAWPNWIWLLLSVAACLCMWRYGSYVWASGQPAHFSDLYASWWAAHESLLHHRDPYSLQVCREIQSRIYGAPVTGAQPGSPAERAGGFAYPLYFVFLLYPVMAIPFATVKVIFDVLLPLLLVLMLGLWLFVLGWRPGPSRFTVLALFVLGSFPAMQGLWLQNPSVIAAFFVAAALASIAASRLIPGGILLALATIKPHFVFLLLLWLGIWTVREWRRRQPLAWSFFATMSLLLLGSEWLDTGWVRHFITVAWAYTHYTFGRSLLEVWFGAGVGLAVAVAVMTGILVLCSQLRASLPQRPEFALACSLLLAATVLVIPTIEPHAQLLLLPGILLLLQKQATGRAQHRLTRLFSAALWMLLIWGWIFAAGLSLASLKLNSSVLQKFWMLPLYTSPLIPLGLLLVLLRIYFEVRMSKRKEASAE